MFSLQPKETSLHSSARYDTANEKHRRLNSYPGLFRAPFYILLALSLNYFGTHDISAMSRVGVYPDQSITNTCSQLAPDSNTNPTSYMDNPDSGPCVKMRRGLPTIIYTFESHKFISSRSFHVKHGLAVEKGDWEAQGCAPNLHQRVWQSDDI